MTSEYWIPRYGEIQCGCDVLKQIVASLSRNGEIAEFLHKYDVTL